MAAYYNEFDSYPAECLRNLIAAGHIPAGEVDERSIEEVQPDDLRGFDQVHLFAGIGGWSHALRLARWPDDEPVWTASCPCPPFSSAGKKKPCPECGGANPVPCPRRTGHFICCLCGHAWLADSRHLWPEVWRLVRDARPPVVFGEQVASADGRVWLAGVRASLEILAYDPWGADLCSAGVGAPNIRQRLFWVADADRGQRGRLADGQGRQRDGAQAGRLEGHGVAQSGGPTGGLADASGERRDGQHALLRPEAAGRNPAALPETAGVRATGGLEHPEGDGRIERRAEPGGRGAAGGRGEGAFGLGDAIQPRLEGHTGHGHNSHEPGRLDQDEARPVAEAGSLGFWSDYEIIPCIDGTARRIEPGIFPLAYGRPGGGVALGDAVAGLTEEEAAHVFSRVGALRGSGNAINSWVAAEFIAAWRERKGWAM